jgi:hypothetical protein
MPNEEELNIIKDIEGKIARVEGEDKRLTARQKIDNDFTYHPPSGDQPERYEAVRANARAFMKLLVDLCPESRELSLAKTHLEETVFWANAAIARNENPVK